MSQNRNYRRDGGRQSYQGSGGYGGHRGASSHMNPWEGGMVPGRSGGGGVTGLLPTPPQTNLLSQLSSPEAQLALASNLLSTLLRPQQPQQPQPQQQVPSLLSLGAFNQGGGVGGGGASGPGYRQQGQFGGPNRFQDRRMKTGRIDGRRVEPYSKPGQGRRGGSARPGADRKTGQGLRSPNLGKGRPISSFKNGGKAGKKDDEKSVSDQDKDKSNADAKGGDGEDVKREDESGKKRDWKEEKKDDDKNKYDDDDEEDEDEDSRYAGIPSVLFYCHICKKHMWDGHSFENHLKGRTHVLMMEKLEESYKIKVELMRHEQKVVEQQREIEMDRMKRQGKKFHLGVREFCTMCDLPFYGSLVTHRKQEKHQQLKSFLHPRCLPCGKEFPTRVEWDHHKLTPYHLKKAAEARKKRVGGSDDEFTIEDFISQETGSYGDMLGKEMKVQTREQEEDDIREVRDKAKDKEGEEAEKADAEADKETAAEKDSSAVKTDDGVEGTDESTSASRANATSGSVRHRIPKYNPDTPVGQQLLKEMTGQLCRACQRFFKCEEDALTHCRTLGHYNNYIVLLKTQARALEAKERRDAEKRKKDDDKKDKPDAAAGDSEKRPIDDDSVDDEGNWKRRKVLTSKNVDDSDVVGTVDKISDEEADTKAAPQKDNDGETKYDPFEAEDSGNETTLKKDKKPTDADDTMWEEVDRDLGNLLDSVENEAEEEAPEDKSERPSRGGIRGRGSKGNVAIRSRAGRRKK